MSPVDQSRQRLLYLHARTPSVFPEVLSFTQIEPVAGFQIEISSNEFDTEPNTVPTWNHVPQAMNRPQDWNLRDRAEHPANILAFGNPLNVSQSDHYKERQIRRCCWDDLIGRPGRSQK